MPTANNDLLRKADLVVADLTANGGLLNPEQASRFIRKLIVQPTILTEARVVEMNAPVRNIDKVGFGSRILRKGASGTALTSAQRSKVTTEQIVLTTSEVIAEVRIPYDVMEDNIERATVASNEPSNAGPGAFRNTVIDLIAERAAKDLEELALLADVDFTDPDADTQAFLSMFDGWIATAENAGNTADQAGAAISKAVFKSGMKTLPDQYLRVRSAMRHYVSVDNEIEYRDTLANRGTALGDAMTTGERDAFAYGAPVKAVSHMPEAKGLFTDPRNLLFGIQRSVSMEFDKDITTRMYIIVLTARIDAKIEEPAAIVIYSNIG